MPGGGGEGEAPPETKTASDRARVDLSTGHREKQTIPCKRLIINELLVLTAYPGQEDPFCPSIPSPPGISVARRVSGKGAMRSHLALPLLLFLLCALLAEGNPNGGRKKGKPTASEQGQWFWKTVRPKQPPPRLLRDKAICWNRCFPSRGEERRGGLG